MELAYSPEHLAFRDQVRAFIAEALPPHLRAKAEIDAHFEHHEVMEWHRILYRKGWVAPHWPTEHGGPGLDATSRFILNEELELANTPALSPFGLVMVAPAIMQFGSDEQKRRFLPPILAGDEVWCQGYSEPNAGSDLASLTTRAEDDGDHFVVNGQKTWTTYAQHADWIFCLVRTDAGGKRQEGISFLLMDMKSPGITVRPLMLMDGAHEVNEVFFDNVKVPVENLVHEEGKGWTVAKYLLGYERMNTGRIGASKRELAKLKDFAATRRTDARFRDRLTRLEVELMALEITNLRFLDQMRRTGQPPGADVSMLKIRGTEIQQSLTELMMQAVGPLSQPFAPSNGDAGFDSFTAGLAPRYCNFRKTSIYAGSNEIQRNIISKMTLGL